MTERNIQIEFLQNFYLEISISGSNELRIEHLRFTVAEELSIGMTYY